MAEHEVNLDNPFDMPEYKEGDNELEMALQNVLATPEGRTLIWHLLGFTKIYDENFSGNSTDIFDKGRRSVGLWLLSNMNDADPTMYPRMLLDVAKRERAALGRLAAQEKDNDRNG